MNLYLLTQHANSGWDTYDSLVVVAPDEETARTILPDFCNSWEDEYTPWAYSPDQVHVTFLGTASPDLNQGVILSSFNAG